MNDKPIISWKVAGFGIGCLLVLATALVKPLGVSTQFVVTNAAITHSVAPEFAESNHYMAKYGEKTDWGIGYGWMLVFGMLVGGGVAHKIAGKKQPQADRGSMPPMWQVQFGNSQIKRYLAAFAGGFMLLFGARLAGGCTSGHMISGISQLAVSSFIFGVFTFVTAVLMAKYLYRRQGA